MSDLAIGCLAFGNFGCDSMLDLITLRFDENYNLSQHIFRERDTI